LRVLCSVWWKKLIVVGVGLATVVVSDITINPLYYYLIDVRVKFLICELESVPTAPLN